ncbi:MAG: glutamate--tRNA ligase, partial [Clostridia bacterium]|nr:glutamate--tRNA ligase [Clostridia bacterium]
VHFFAEEGYPVNAVIEYLMTIAASDFEDWRRANPAADYRTFKFNPKKLSVSGALFDNDKLNDVSKVIISKMQSGEVYGALCDWAKEFDGEFYGILTANGEYTKKMLAVDRDNVKNARKDIAKWSEAKDYFSYYFDSLFTPLYSLPERVSSEDAKAFLDEYIKVYDPADDRQVWFDKIKAIAPALGFAAETKEYKAQPDKFKGAAGDLSGVLRLAVTGRANTPDLCGIMSVLGREKCVERIKEYTDNI